MNFEKEFLIKWNSFLHNVNIYLCIYKYLQLKHSIIVFKNLYITEGLQ